MTDEVVLTYAPYEQYAQLDSGGFAWTFNKLSLALYCKLGAENGEKILEDIIRNSEFIRQIELRDNQALLDSNVETWIALLRREKRYRDKIPYLSAKECHHPEYIDGSIDFAWTIEAIALIATTEKTRMKDVIDVLPLPEAKQIRSLDPHDPGYRFIPMINIYKSKKDKL